MTYLDTNFLVFALSSGTSEDQKLRAMLSAGEQVNISAIVWTEFACGPVSSEHLLLAAKLFPHPEPFLGEDGNRAAELFNGTGRRRGSLIDCMIAAVCLRAGASIATNNVADFQRFASSGLLVLAP